VRVCARALCSHSKRGAAVDDLEQRRLVDEQFLELALSGCLLGCLACAAMSPQTHTRARARAHSRLRQRRRVRRRLVAWRARVCCDVAGVCADVLHAWMRERLPRRLDLAQQGIAHAQSQCVLHVDRHAQIRRLYREHGDECVLQLGQRRRVNECLSKRAQFQNGESTASLFVTSGVPSLGSSNALEISLGARMRTGKRCVT
jgi:hypothetical protein